jgi:hypothetical protein
LEHNDATANEKASRHQNQQTFIYIVYEVQETVLALILQACTDFPVMPVFLKIAVFCTI